MTAPIWNADLETGDLSQWGGFETRTNPQATPQQRVTVLPMEAGSPLKIKNFMRATVKPGDRYMSSTGERGMFRQYKNDNDIWRDPGYDSTVTFAIRTSSGYPFGSNVWVGGMEWHQRGGRGGPAPVHHITYADRFHGDVSGGPDSSNPYHRYLEHDYFVGRNPGDWYAFALRVAHNVAPNGIYEISGAHVGVDTQMNLLLSAHEIGTMFQLTNGQILQNYSLWCLYRAIGPQTTLEIDMAACREYRQSSDAIAYLNSLFAAVQPALRKKAETATTITLEWDAIVGVYGYRFFADGVAKSVTFDPTVTTIKFQKGATEYAVLPIKAGDLLTYRP